MVLGVRRSDQIDVLVVDDEPIVRFLTAEVLRTSGMSVAVAADAPAALTQLSESAVGTIVLDIKLPGIDGFGFLDSVSQLPPVVVLSGGEWDREVAARGAKVFAYARKPIDASALIALVWGALHGPQTRPRSTWCNDRDRPEYLGELRRRTSGQAARYRPGAAPSHPHA